MRANFISTAILVCAVACSSKSPVAPDAGEPVAIDDAGADSSVVDAGPPYDPPPVEIDRTGLIPTSGKQLLLSNILSEADTGGPQDWLALDLESGELHELVRGVRLGHVYPARDSRTALLDFYPGTEFDPGILMVRLLDDGVVPAQHLAAALGSTGRVFGPTLLGDGRFAVVHRFGEDAAHVLDVIDMHASTILTSIDVGAGTDDAISVYEGPDGMSFLYGYGEGEDARVGFGRITAEGLETNEGSGPLGYPVLFSPDRSRVIFRSNDSEELSDVFYYRDLPAGDLIPVDSLTEGSDSFAQVEMFSSDRDRVIVSFDNGEQLRRLSLTNRASVPVTAPEYRFERAMRSRDGRIALLEVRNDSGSWLVDPTVVDATGLSPVMPIDVPSYRQSGGAVGAHHICYDLGQTGTAVVGRDAAGALQSVTVAGQPERRWRYDGPLVSPDDRFIFVSNERGIVMVDLDEARAVEAGSIEAEHGTLSYPVWNAEGTAFAYTEFITSFTGVDNDGDGFRDVEAESWVYVVRWPKGGSPSEPELVFNGEGWLEVLIAQP